MIEFILSLFTGLFGFLSSVLPNDPFLEYLQVAQGMETGIQWLNWFLAVEECATVTLVWIGVMVIWRSAQTLIMNTVKTAGNVVSS